MVIGISDYQHPGIPDIKYAAEDARAIRRFLVEEAGFAPDHVVLLVNEQATQREIMRAMGDHVPARAGQDDLVFLFYAGHGAPEISAAEPDGYAKYLVPYDAQPDSLFSSALPMEMVRKIFSRIRARTLIFAADTCYSGAAGGRTLGGPGGTRDLNITAGFLDVLAQGSGRIILSASQANEPSFESDQFRHGLFTYFLLEGLSGKADRDGDSVVTVREAYDYTSPRVAEVSKQRQRPLWKSEESGQVVLVDRRQRLELANLVIRTQPAGATVFVGGRLRGVAKPELIVPGLPVGQHEVVARLEWYAEAREKVTVAAGAAPLVMTLTATRGGLRVASVPAGARVMVDGIERGQTELAVADLAPGPHRVEVTRVGYRPYQGSVEVRAGEIAPLNLSLEPLERRAETEMTGILHVTSEPDKAQVYLDGALVGETPLTLESVTAGEHRLRVSKRFFEAVELAERIEPVRATRRAVKLARSPATLIVRSDLGGGELLVDGKAVGKLQPLQKVALEAGPHRVAVRHPQAGTITRDIELEPGEQTMQFSKADDLGSLTIVSDVPLSRLTVQGRVVDPPPVTVENLPAGEVLISATAAGGNIRKRAPVKPGATSLVRIQADDVRATPAGGIEFVEIPPGEFMMGSESGDSDEKPVHRVRISRPFEMGMYEVTQAQWEAVMGSNPSHFKGADRPVESVSWNDAQEFLRRLNARSDGYRYRLPTEAEWEYAARAGSQGDRYGNLDDIGWYDGNTGRQTHPVGQKQPNAWGLYDMHGNVGEWCLDWYAADYYRTSPAEDPPGPTTGE